MFNVIIMNILLNFNEIVENNLENELTIAFIAGGLLLLAIICLTIIKKLKDK